MASPLPSIASSSTASGSSRKGVEEFRADIQAALKSCKDDKATAECLGNFYMNYRKDQALNIALSVEAYPLGDLARALVVYAQSEKINLNDNIPETFSSGGSTPIINHTTLGAIFVNADRESGRVKKSIEFFSKTSNPEPMFVAFAKEAISFIEKSELRSELSTWGCGELKKDMASQVNNIKKQAKILFAFYRDFCQNQTTGIMPTMTALPLGNLANALGIYGEKEDLESPMAEWEQAGMAYSSKTTTINEIFKDTVNADGKVNKSILYFNEGPFKNEVLVTFGTEASKLVKKKIAKVVN